MKQVTTVQLAEDYVEVVEKMAKEEGRSKANMIRRLVILGIEAANRQKREKH